MSYVPPSGSSSSVSWNPSLYYTPPVANTASVSWKESALYLDIHPWSVNVSWFGVSPYQPFSDISEVDVSWSSSPGGYSARRGDEVQLNLGELVVADAPLELVLGIEFAVTTADEVFANGKFRLAGAGAVSITYPVAAAGKFNLSGYGDVRYLGVGFSDTIYVGQSSETTLTTEIHFAWPAWVGESSAITLSSTVSIPFAFSSGEAVSAVVQRRVQPDPVFPFGQIFSFDLTIQSTQTQFGCGESLSASLYVYDLIATTAADGAMLGVTLATTTSIPFTFYAGETHTSAVEFHPTSYPSVSYSTGEVFAATAEWHPASYPSASFSTGESLVSDLYVKRNALMTVWMSAGESLSSSMGLPSRADIAINMWTGATFAIPTVSAAPHLGAVSMATGQSSTVALVEQENYRIYPGESMEFTLTWSPSVRHTYSTGENCAVILDTRPGEPFRIQMWNGENFGAINMSIQVATQLSVTFRTGVWIESSFDDATTSYDLELPCCGPEVGKLPGESEIFELEGELPSYVRLPDAKLLFTCELSARPRFHIAFGAGEAFTTVERNIDFVDLEPIQQGGFWVTGDWLDVSPNHNLCYPNFIPDGDAIVVELEYEDEGCYADYAHTGESFSAALRTIQSLPVGTNYTGESMWFDLNTRNPYMWFRFEVGEHLRQGNFPANPQVNMGHGERMSFTFETPTYLFGCSESMEVSLTLTYDVEFMEVGCLDNEYKYQNEYGDEDFSKFNAVAVELEPFFHQIKARCY